LFGVLKAAFESNASPRRNRMRRKPAATRSSIAALKSAEVRRLLVSALGQPVKFPVALTQAVLPAQNASGSSTVTVRVTLC